ncbi:hypothetical protein JY471_04610 [Stenotrophomonas maltophilia]|uniref:hypothetical protein n=1 Tax=Stenotrophomonas maltophilia TaxID=40324 RepID=UPI0012FD6463|nr:hypothetical protein [Stenotrophomonas maltophilia]MBN5141805.1 hypothetical protein [Stenotrophomonas maltophilia]
MKHRSYLFITVLWMMVIPAWAQTVETVVTGQFRPNAANPSNTSFENTTPRGAFCNWRPTECDKAGAYIFDLGTGEFWQKNGDGDNESRRDTTYVRFPAPRSITLRDERTGATAQARVGFVAMSLRLNFGNGADPWYHGVSGGCTAIRGAGGRGWSNGGWGVRDPSNPQECYSSQRRNGRSYSYRNVGIGIQVELPDAITLQNGRYIAQEDWTTGGAEADIDLGDNVSGVKMIRLNFVFDVTHELEVRFPGEMPKATLVPDGGWRAWIDHAIRPTRLSQELPFFLTSSMDFSLKLRCEHELDNHCGIRNLHNNDVIPVAVDVTIPGMRSRIDGSPVQGMHLPPGDLRAPRLTPDAYMVQRRSTLRFTAEKAAVDEMLKSPGSHWEGNMTVVFDANP